MLFLRTPRPTESCAVFPRSQYAVMFFAQSGWSASMTRGSLGTLDGEESSSTASVDVIATWWLTMSLMVACTSGLFTSTPAYTTESPAFGHLSGCFPEYHS